MIPESFDGVLNKQMATFLLRAPQGDFSTMTLSNVLCYSSLLLVGLAAQASGAEQTWTGQISDSPCGASHSKMTAAHAGMTDRDCVQACIKAGGKYVFVSDGKVFKIANQDLSLLATHAGHTVRLTGDMKDDTITVSGIVMPSK